MGVLKAKVNTLSEGDKIDFLRRIIHVFDNNTVEYWLEFGTLLGCVRDHGFIEWDSDIDIGVFDIDILDNLVDEFKKVGLVLKPKKVMYRYKSFEIYDPSFPESSYFHADIYGFILNKDRYEYHWIIRKNLICRVANYVSYIFRREPVVNAGAFRISLTNKIIDFTRVIPDLCMDLCHTFFNTIDMVFSQHRVLVFSMFNTVKVPFYDMYVSIPSNAEDHLLVNYGHQWRVPLRVTQMGGDDFVRECVDGVEYCWI